MQARIWPKIRLGFVESEKGLIAAKQREKIFQAARGVWGHAPPENFVN